MKIHHVVLEQLMDVVAAVMSPTPSSRTDEVNLNKIDVISHVRCQWW
jgi:hypothetical protein